MGIIIIGYTHNLKLRFEQHQNGEVESTSYSLRYYRNLITDR